MVSAPLVNLAQQLRGWTDSVLGVAGPATEMALGIVKARTGDPKKQAVIGRAGATLKRMREAAGLTVDELARAVDLSDPEMLAAAEGGVAALPFEVVLRLGGVLGRSDPLTATMKLARAYNPQLWKAMDDLGVGRLVVQAGRERELANLYRGNDDARRLSDEEFAEVLAFTKTAFDMAVRFRFAGSARTAGCQGQRGMTMTTTTTSPRKGASASASGRPKPKTSASRATAPSGAPRATRKTASVAAKAAARRGLPEIAAVPVDARRKDLDALQQAGRSSYEGVRKLVRRQVTQLKATLGEWQAVIQLMRHVGPRESLVQLDELGKRAKR
jgi:transcriptional regulator with XRE-family HTH domain